MSDAGLQFLDVGDPPRAIAYRTRAGAAPGLFWLCGFKSDMDSTKARALDEYCAGAGRALTRFDYSGHGASGGRFEEGTLSRWLEEAMAVFASATAGPQVLVGSSMGGYLALLMANALAKAGQESRLAGMALIAPAVDFTEALIWEQASPAARRAIMEQGAWMRATPYAPDPYPITQGLIEDGRRHLMLGGAIRTHCPVRILQGMKDPDVPFTHAMTLVEHIAGDPVTLTLIKDGDHRLSRPEDLALLIAAIEGLS